MCQLTFKVGKPKSSFIWLENQTLGNQLDSTREAYTIRFTQVFKMLEMYFLRYLLKLATLAISARWTVFRSIVCGQVKKCIEYMLQGNLWVHLVQYNFHCMTDRS